MTEPTTCCHTHEVMDVAAAIVTPGKDVDALKAKLEQARGLLVRTRETLNCVAAELPIDMVLAAINELDTFLEEKP